MQKGGKLLHRQDIYYLPLIWGHRLRELRLTRSLHLTPPDTSLRHLVTGKIYNWHFTQVLDICPLDLTIPHVSHSFSPSAAGVQRSQDNIVHSSASFAVSLRLNFSDYLGMASAGCRGHCTLLWHKQPPTGVVFRQHENILCRTTVVFKSNYLRFEGLCGWKDKFMVTLQSTKCVRHDWNCSYLLWTRWAWPIQFVLCSHTQILFPQLAAWLSWLQRKYWLYDSHFIMSKKKN